MVDEQNSGNNGENRDLPGDPEQLNIALKYTKGDETLAQKMISGEFNDASIIKGKIVSEINRDFGYFMIFLSKSGLYVKSIRTVVDHFPYFLDLKLNLPWDKFFQEIEKKKSKIDVDRDISVKIGEYFRRKLNASEISKINSFISKSDPKSIIHLFETLFSDNKDTASYQLDIQCEESNSLKIEQAGIDDEHILFSMVEESGQATEEEESELPSEIESLSKTALKGSAVLSPIKGKVIHQLRAEEIIKVYITDSSPRGREAVQKLGNAMEDGNLKALPATIRYINKTSDGKWLIFASVSASVHVKIEEESDNVRLAVADPVGPKTASRKKDKEKKKSSKGRGPWILILLGVVLFVLFAFILFKL